MARAVATSQSEKLKTPEQVLPQVYSLLEIVCCACSKRNHLTMPPRLQLLSRASTATVHAPYQPVAPFLYPCLQQQQQRSASILSQLSDTKGAYNRRIRVGRGPSSGYGKTSGRGHKGQKQHGKVPAGFNGGQTPDWVVHGKRGFKNQYALDLGLLSQSADIKVQFLSRAVPRQPEQDPILDQQRPPRPKQAHHPPRTRLIEMHPWRRARWREIAGARQGRAHDPHQHCRIPRKR